MACERIDGSVAAVDRQAAAERFNGSGTSPVLLLSLRAGGVGLNLTGANHLMLVDLHWNPSLEAQACDRVFRVGQDRPVTVHRFVCDDTIEQRIQALQVCRGCAHVYAYVAQSAKRGLAQQALQDGTDPQQRQLKLTRSDLLQLFQRRS